MEHSSLKQLSLYPLTTHFFVKAINLENGDIKTFKDIALFEYPKLLKHLQYLNCNGFNVFFSPKPAGLGGVDFLLDDITRDGIEQLEQDGFKPVYYLETSPSNFQVVLRFNTNKIDKDEYLQINRYLVKKYCADSGSIGTEHYFRLAGFTNRKAKYCKNGQYPFVKLTVSTPTILDKSLLSAMTQSKTTHTPQPCGFRGKKEKNGSCDNYISAIYNSAGGISDISRLDWKVSRMALSKGFSNDEIAASIRKYSPSLENRKRRHIDDYISRTIKNASLLKK